MSLKIEIPLDHQITTIRDFSKLFNSIRTCDLLPNVDVTNYPYFNPKEILMLTQYFVVQNSHKIDGYINVDNRRGWYIEAIDLAGFCNTNYKKPKNLPQSISTAIPIKRIDISTMDAYIFDAKQFFSTFCKGKDISVLSICISEIINNVYDHSRSEYDAFIFSQYYPTNRQIKFAISDLGIGITRTVNDFLTTINKEQLKNIDALKWALVRNNTVKSKKHNAGAGLDNILSYLHGVGNIEIFTNDVYCSFDKNKQIYFGKNPISEFIGTLIEITINIHKLDPIDETILEDITF